MIPISLSIKGLYSYQEAQHIDFNSLTSSGLFGIFGAVGSGKSSILEAMMFVLFNESDRLNASRDNRYYNMLNLQSNELMLDFIFLAGNNNSEKYRFRFLAKRHKKDYDKVEVKERHYYHWVDQDWLPMEGIKDASTILGMSYQNFMQTIIIPQGKFREFVDHSAGKRTEMLKELFQLNKFDLFRKTNILLNNNKEKIDTIQGRLMEIGEIHEEEITAKEEELKEIIINLEKAELKCKARKAEEDNFKILKNLFLQIKEKEEKLANLNIQKKEIHAKEYQISIYEKAFTFLNEKIKLRERLNSELIRIEEDKSLLKTQQDKNQKSLKKTQEEFIAAKEAFDSREQVKQKCDDLEVIIKLKYIQENICKLLKILEKSKKDSEEAELAYDLLKRILADKEMELQVIEDALPDQSQLLDALKWHEWQQNLQKDVKKHQDLVEVNIQKLESIEKEKENYPFLNGASKSFEEIFSFLKTQDSQNNQKKAALEKDLQGLLVQQKLAEFTINLQENEPCPVCGSLHHPAVAEVRSVEDRLLHNNAAIEELEEHVNSLKDLEKKMVKLQMERDQQFHLIDDKKKDLREAEQTLVLHQENFTWKIYQDQTFTQLVEIKESTDLKHKKAFELKNSIKKIKQEISGKEKLLNESKTSLNSAEKSIAKEEASEQTLKEELKQLQFEKFERFSIDQLRESLKKGKQQYAEITSKFEEANHQLQKLKQDEQMILGQLKSLEINLSQLIQNLESLDVEILNLILEKGFENLDQVKQVLSKAIDINSERKKIEAFNQDLHSTQEALQNYYQEAKGNKYDEQKHLETVKELQELESLIEEKKNKCTLQKRLIEELRKKLAARIDCKKKLENLLLREQNIKELKKLFTGNGFVRYVSSIYLQELCKAANQRFFKLTQNNLSLELNQDEEFIVRDYLNNGKTRLLKTLSGGQTFQAALCLALALAENVKSLNKADKSFFFLDEGFGSLDKESLRVVFDTLKTLRKENRIVGIISHVEELQQEIDVYLKIVNDKERGSQVSYSWK